MKLQPLSNIQVPAILKTNTISAFGPGNFPHFPQHGSQHLITFTKYGLIATIAPRQFPQSRQFPLSKSCPVLLSPHLPLTEKHLIYLKINLFSCLYSTFTAASSAKIL